MSACAYVCAACACMCVGNGPLAVAKLPYYKMYEKVCMCPLHDPHSRNRYVYVDNIFRSHSLKNQLTILKQTSNKQNVKMQNGLNWLSVFLFLLHLKYFSILLVV
jgi:hypothetical protein